MLQEDLGTLVPGNNVPLNGDALLRLALYAGLLLFVFRLMFASPSSAGDPDFFKWERSGPKAQPKIESPRNI